MGHVGETYTHTHTHTHTHTNFGEKLAVDTHLVEK